MNLRKHHHAMFSIRGIAQRIVSRIAVFAIMMLLAWLGMDSLALLPDILPPADGNDVRVSATPQSTEGFCATGMRIDESGSSEQSGNPCWWLNSGGQFFIEDDGTGKTLKGDLPWFARWRLRYMVSNPRDTEGGSQPQNIFRLVRRTQKKDLEQEISFRITDIHLAKSTERNASNGILLMLRYQNGDNLYYAGIRVDGAAVIKKKREGTYTTLAYVPYFRSDAPYHRDTNPNLIPGDRWIGLRSTIMTDTDGIVRIRLYVRSETNSEWMLAAAASDDGNGPSGATIDAAGAGGIRSDFMDVDIKNYRIVQI